ncbi:sugar transferase [Acidobacteria bacterium AH-259-D05]|nr:sugar transferase [Acidobacteria bacterium AH-259-D05]
METTFTKYPFLKCFLDKAVALILLGLFAPIILIIFLSMAVSMWFRKSDRGSWLYRERRISRGKEFDILKFRVLREDVIAQMPAGNRHSHLLEKKLENLTWAGRFILKKCYLDELPQLFNILKGDMSLVGPRPWPVELHLAQVESGIVYRNLIRAGWTGPAQLQKGKRVKREAEELDIDYVQRCNNWSAWRLAFYDLQVLFQTVKLVREGQGLKD